MKRRIYLHEADPKRTVARLLREQFSEAVIGVKDDADTDIILVVGKHPALTDELLDDAIGRVRLQSGIAFGVKAS